MATGTSWYNLSKPATNENYDVGVWNTNLDMIDAQMHQNETEVFGGATSLANGTVGNVPAPLIADKDKYLKGDGTWAEVQGGGGGGSTVIPNPTGTPTDTLDTVSIDGTIYEIQGGGNAEQDILYIASSMTETQISVDLTAYDEYIFYGNDVLASQQIPQGNSFPRCVIEKAITDSSNIAIYGYSNSACAYTVAQNGLTYLSGGGGYRITMIVGIKW